MEKINKLLSGTLVPLFLLIYALFFIFKLKALPLKKSIFAIKSMLKRKDIGSVSPIRAVFVALAGTLGVGNIVGVASAIALGGAGSVFWMWVSAFLAMILKYSEIVLAMLHRRYANNQYYGGAVYYMMDYFTSVGKRITGEIYTFVFAVLCLCNGFTMGGVIQSNAISESMNSTFNWNKVACGVFIALMLIFVFFLNAKGIFSLCEKLVPAVSTIYICLSLLAISQSVECVPEVFSQIISEAFDFQAIAGGVLGINVSMALRYGTIRGLFSNEAGCGTSPVAHAASSSKSPCEQGVLGIVEVFIDTIVVCTLTAFVILINWESACAYVNNPIMMCFAAFGSNIGVVSDYLLTICVFLFAFATIVCWGYYGKECVYFLNKSSAFEKIFYAAYVAAVFTGTFIKLDLIWQIADFAVGAMTLMNLYMLGKMNREIKNETLAYFKKRAPQGSSKIKE